MSYYLVRTVHTGLAGSPYLSTHYFQNLADGEAQNCADLVSAFWDDLKTVVDSGNTSLVSNVVQVVQETTGNIIEESIVITAGVTGTNSGTEEWTAKQGVLGFRTTTFIDGKRLYGRTYIPGVPGSAGEQVPTTGYRTVLTTAGNNLVADSGTNGTPLCAVRRPKEDPFVPGAIAPITSCKPSLQWGVLRSRRT